MNYYSYMESAHRAQARAYRAYALASSLDHTANEADRRRQVDHFADMASTYDRLADDYLDMIQPNHKETTP